MAIFSRRHKSEKPLPAETISDAARGIWGLCENHSLADLQTYLAYEADPNRRKQAVIEFLSNVSVPDILAEICASVEIVSRELEGSAYDWALLQNIHVWGWNLRKPDTSTDNETALCTIRMGAIASTYREYISAPAIEVAIQFFLQVLGSKETHTISTTTWERCFEVAVEFARRNRESRSLTREELIRLRDALVISRPYVALALERRIRS